MANTVEMKPEPKKGLNHAQLKEAADAAQSLHKQLRGVFLIGEALETIGSLEALEAETQTRLDTTRKELAEVEAKKASAKAVVDEAADQADALNSRAESLSKAVVADAEADAAKRVAAAVEEAAAIVATAKASADKTAAELLVAVDKLSRVNAAAAEAEKRHDHFKKEYEALKAKLA